jgi:hypothetical protein
VRRARLLRMRGAARTQWTSATAADQQALLALIGPRHPLAPHLTSWNDSLSIPAMLSHITPEVLHLVLAFACTDGGPTVASLLQCSRYISAVAQPFRFLIVRVFGPHQLSRFMRAFRAASQQALEDGGPSVHVDRLMLSYRIPASRPLPDPTEAYSGLNGIKAWLNQLTDLFACVGGRLRGLVLLLPALPPTSTIGTALWRTVQAFSIITLKLFAMADFPVLETLSFNYTPDAPEGYRVRPLRRLRRLQVQTCGHPENVLPMLRIIANACLHGVRLVLRDMDVNPRNDEIVRGLLGEFDLLESWDTKTAFPHIEICPINELPDMRSVQEAYRERVTVLPVTHPLIMPWMPGTVDEWKEDWLW